MKNDIDFESVMGCCKQKPTKKNLGLVISLLKELKIHITLSVCRISKLKEPHVRYATKMTFG